MLKKCITCHRYRDPRAFRRGGAGHTFAQCNGCRQKRRRLYKKGPIDRAHPQDRIEKNLKERWDFRFGQGDNSEPNITLPYGFSRTARTELNLPKVLSTKGGNVK